MPILMFINIKGGVAKTTNAVAVSEFLAEAGHRVLLIDADHQCAAGEILLGESRLERCDWQLATLHDLLNEMMKDEFNADTFADYVISVNAADAENRAGQLSVLPSSLRIDDFQKNYNRARQDSRTNDEFHSVLARRFRGLRKWLHSSFDYTIIDCPPSLPMQVQLLIKAADAYVVPCIPDKLSVRGSHYLVERFRKKKYKLPGLGTIWTLYRDQNTIHRDMVELSTRRKEFFAEIPQVFETIIPNATAIARALESPHVSLNEKYSPAMADRYRRLVSEIVDRCNANLATSA